MPLPVLIISLEKNIAYLPDLPLDLIVLSYGISELLNCSVALRGIEVVNHFFRQPQTFKQLDFRASASISASTINVLKGIAQYSKGKFELNGINFQITFIETDQLIFKLSTNHNNIEMTINVYEYNINFEFDINSLEIVFSRETPNGLIKLETRHLEALTLYVERQPQISIWFRKSFKSDSITTLPYHNLVKVIFNILKLTEDGFNVLHFSKLLTNCLRCKSNINQTSTSTSTTSLMSDPLISTASSMSLNNKHKHRYIEALNLIAYQFKCSHMLCLKCILQLVKTNNGVTKCHLCMNDLEHHSLLDDYQINWNLIKPLFLYCRDPVQNFNDQSNTHLDFKDFKDALI